MSILAIEPLSKDVKFSDDFYRELNRRMDPESAGEYFSKWSAEYSDKARELIEKGLKEENEYDFEIRVIGDAGDGLDVVVCAEPVPYKHKESFSTFEDFKEAINYLDENPESDVYWIHNEMSYLIFLTSIPFED